MSALPFRTVAARPKRIVYLTPGLDLPFWRYPSRAWKPPPRPGYDAKRWTRATARKSSSTTRKTPSRAAWRVWSYRPRTPRPRPASFTRPAPRKSPSSSPTSAPRGRILFRQRRQLCRRPMRRVRRWPPGCRKEGWQDSAFGISAISQARKNGQRAPGFLDGLRAGGAQAGRPACNRPATAEETFRLHPGHAGGQSRSTRALRSDRPADDRRCAP